MTVRKFNSSRRKFNSSKRKVNKPKPSIIKKRKSASSRTKTIQQLKRIFAKLNIHQRTHSDEKDYRMVKTDGIHILRKTQSDNLIVLEVLGDFDMIVTDKLRSEASKIGINKEVWVSQPKYDHRTNVNEIFIYL